MTAAAAMARKKAVALAAQGGAKATVKPATKVGKLKGRAKADGGGKAKERAPGPDAGENGGAGGDDAPTGCGNKRRVESEPEGREEGETTTFPEAVKGADPSTGSEMDEEPSPPAVDCEDAHDYRVGGYCPVQKGDSFKDERYTVIDKLGWGQFSTVWRCRDKFAANVEAGPSMDGDANKDRRTDAASDLCSWSQEPRRIVALKIQKSAKRYSEAARDEIIILKQINSGFCGDDKKADVGRGAAAGGTRSQKENPYRRFIVQLLDSFETSSAHGRHVCMCFEELGCTLLDLIKWCRYRGASLPIVRVISAQILAGTGGHLGACACRTFHLRDLKHSCCVHDN